MSGLARQSPAPGGGIHPITLDVTVTDKAGHPITGLQQADFTLLDNKTPQKILSFRAVQSAASTPGLPVEVVLVMDEVNASFRAVAQTRQQIQKFLTQSAGELSRPISFVFFSDKGAEIESKPSTDAKVLLAALDQHQNGLRSIGRAQGFYGAGDRFELSLKTLGQLATYEQGRPGRKLVVWVSPGWPLLSGPRVQLSSKTQQQLFSSIVAVSDQLRAARITLYSVDPLGTADAGGLRTFYWESFTKGVKESKQVEVGNLALQVLASQSGGRVFNSSNDVAGEIATCIDDANSFYVLSFDGQPGDGPNDYHAIALKVDRPDAMPRTRTGYYSQPESPH